MGIYRIHMNMGYAVLIFPLSTYAAELHLLSQSTLSQITDAQNMSLVALTQKKQQLENTITTITREQREAWGEKLKLLNQEYDHLQAEINLFDDTIYSISSKIDFLNSVIIKIDSQGTCIIDCVDIRKYCERAFVLIPNNGTFAQASTVIKKVSEILSSLITEEAPTHIITQCFKMYVDTQATWCVQASKKFDMDQNSEFFISTTAEFFTYIRQNNPKQAQSAMQMLTTLCTDYQKKFFTKQKTLCKAFAFHLSDVFNIRTHINEKKLENKNKKKRDSAGGIGAEIMCRDFYREELRLKAQERPQRDLLNQKKKLLAEQIAHIARKITRYADLKRELNDTLDKFSFHSPSPLSTPALSPDDPAIILALHKALKADPLPALSLTPPADQIEEQDSQQDAGPNVPPPLILTPRHIDLGTETRVVTEPKPPRQPFRSKVFTFQRPIDTATDTLHSKG
ncbi:MAG: hypothetical protein ACHQVS_01475 [Candidatus Babeliales bacterium]